MNTEILHSFYVFLFITPLHNSKIKTKFLWVKAQKSHQNRGPEECGLFKTSENNLKKTLLLFSSATEMGAAREARGCVCVTPSWLEDGRCRSSVSSGNDSLPSLSSWRCRKKPAHLGNTPSTFKSSPHAFACFMHVGSHGCLWNAEVMPLWLWE